MRINKESLAKWIEKEASLIKAQDTRNKKRADGRVKTDKTVQLVGRLTTLNRLLSFVNKNS